MARILATAVLIATTSGLSSLGPGLQNLDHVAFRQNMPLVGNSEGTLPLVHDILPLKALSTLKSNVAALEEGLSHAQHHKMDMLIKSREQYELNLTAQRKENDNLEHENARLAFRAMKLQNANGLLRQKAANVTSANVELKGVLTMLSSHLTLAREFAQEGLASSETNASAVQVLADVATSDQRARNNIRKRALLDGISSTSSQVSLLQSSSDVHQRSSGDILDAIWQSLSSLSNAETRSETLLKDAFEKQFYGIMSKREDLLSEQTLLNETIVKTQQLHDRLSTAVKYLSKVHDHLWARVKAIRTFAYRIGDSHGEVKQMRETDRRANRTKPNLTNREVLKVSTRNRQRAIHAASHNRSQSYPLTDAQTNATKSLTDVDRRFNETQTIEPS
eukprot:TRINITY_DN5559_c1_g4_i2.p1 TRINITY_DN5559_c1_g4~~TRINITY_DN5559_c1_g4_i2.p1  ORF type:complete len:414 (-),score=51.06 TRINITY_DN5559_c1_g4_i2:365-1540(-)